MIHLHELALLNNIISITSYWLRRKLPEVNALNLQTGEKGYTGLNVWNVEHSEICVSEHLAEEMLSCRAGEGWGRAYQKLFCPGCCCDHEEKAGESVVNRL